MSQVKIFLILLLKYFCLCASVQNNKLVVTVHNFLLELSFEQNILFYISDGNNSIHPNYRDLFKNNSLILLTNEFFEINNKSLIKEKLLARISLFNAYPNFVMFINDSKDLINTKVLFEINTSNKRMFLLLRDSEFLKTIKRQILEHEVFNVKLGIYNESGIDIYNYWDPYLTKERCGRGTLKNITKII